MNEQIILQTTLKRKFLEYQGRNKNFSVRALARRLGMQPGATNEILKGERRVSRRIAERIADKLMLDSAEKDELLKNFPDKLTRRTRHSPDKTVNELKAMKLTAEQFKAISEWIHFAILSLMKTPTFNHSSAWMAERFQVPVGDIDQALERLIATGLITKDEFGHFNRTASCTSTTDDVLNLSLQKAHLSDMEMAREKIQKLPVEVQEFSFLIFNGNPKYLSKAREILRRSQDELEELMDQDEANDVYKVCTYLYPLTKVEPITRPATIH